MLKKKTEEEEEYIVNILSLSQVCFGHHAICQSLKTQRAEGEIINEAVKHGFGHLTANKLPIRHLCGNK